MGRSSAEFKSIWRKGEQPPEHVVDRAEKDIATERREVTNSILNLASNNFEYNPITTAMRATNAPVSKIGKEAPEPVSGDYLGRAHHFKQAAMEYVDKMQKDYKDE